MATVWGGVGPVYAFLAATGVAHMGQVVARVRVEL
jgi:hypothetical protein